MFKKMFFSKEKFIENFKEKYQEVSPKHISIEVSDDSLKSVWKISEDQSIGVDLNQTNLKLTNTNSLTKKVTLTEDLLGHIINNNQRVILEKIEQSKEALHQFPNIDQPSDGEQKGEEWLKVTNHVLKESLNKASTDENLIVEAKLFIGKLKESGELNIRLQCYNLDYSLTFLPNGKLYLSVFDDKNFQRGHSKTPSYSGEFFNNRPVILNEFIKLIFDIFSKSKIKIFEKK
ncbi:hypothetical protein [Halobacteriovorax sp.]|uniref:hypothetical protein n=1 Tax=Halobacteriovorax sp. TaxID=2020862 RepID=UPI003561E662